MAHSILATMRKLNSEHLRKNAWYRILSALMCMTVFFTTYALILPAITLEADKAAVCGLVDHEHTDECSDENGELICELTEHKHDMVCFVSDLDLFDHYCGKYEHTHSDDCYLDGSLICSLVEHTHMEMCDIPPEEEPICECTEHVHEQACVDENGELICELSEHTHTFECYAEPEKPIDYICGFEYAHTHEDSCYVDGVLICSMIEHTHTQLCDPEFRKWKTILSEPAADGAFVEISGTIPDDAFATIENVHFSDEEIVDMFGQEKADSMEAFVAYDIKIMREEDEWQPDDTVKVMVHNPDIEVSGYGKLEVTHIEDETGELTAVAAEKQPDGAISFQAESFSTYTITVTEPESTTTIRDDADTSDLNSRFKVGGNYVAANDGRVEVDKTVQYVDASGGDFDITLSALGQSYNQVISKEDMVHPDVVFVLDLSRSMFKDPIYDDELHRFVPRINGVVKAMNGAISMLMDADPYTRIGIVSYGDRKMVSDLNGNAVYLALANYNNPENGYLTISDNTIFAEVDTTGNKQNVAPTINATSKVTITPGVPSADHTQTISTNTTTTLRANGWSTTNSNSYTRFRLTRSGTMGNRNYTVELFGGGSTTATKTVTNFPANSPQQFTYGGNYWWVTRSGGTFNFYTSDPSTTERFVRLDTWGTTNTVNQERIGTNTDGTVKLYNAAGNVLESHNVADGTYQMFTSGSKTVWVYRNGNNYSFYDTDPIGKYYVRLTDWNRRNSGRYNAEGFIVSADGEVILHDAAGNTLESFTFADGQTYQFTKCSKDVWVYRNGSNYYFFEGRPTVNSIDDRYGYADSANKPINKLKVAVNSNELVNQDNHTHPTASRFDYYVPTDWNSGNKHGYGTYTQQGLDAGKDMLVGASDKEMRMPVMMLVSDGVPTYYDTNYQNPGNSPGGNGSSTGATADMGYWTIRTAMYDKEQIDTAYKSVQSDERFKNDAMFFTIGPGVQYLYGQTVLSPGAIMAGETEVNWRRCENDNEKHSNESGDVLPSQLYNLMTSGTTKLTPEQLEYVNYADWSIAGDLTANELIDGMDMIIEKIRAIPRPVISASDVIVGDFIDRNAYISFTDVIGNGMQLKDSAPILTYGSAVFYSTSTESGTLSGGGYHDNSPYTLYKYSGTVVEESTGGDLDMSNVRVYVIETDEGQVVEWQIPASNLPIIYHNSKNDTFIDSPPIRLKYQVEPQGGVVKPWYLYETNSTSDTASCMFKVAEENPYYHDDNAKNGEYSTTTKTGDNDTRYHIDAAKAEERDPNIKTYSTKYSMGPDDKVTVYLGNNGTIYKDIAVEELPSTGGITATPFVVIGICMIAMPFVVILVLRRNGERRYYW